MSNAVPFSQVLYMAGLNEIGHTTLVVSVFLTVLSAVAVGLRLWTRRILGNRVGVDDWLILVSWFIFLGFSGNILVGVYTCGGGQVYTSEEEARKKLVQYLQSSYAIAPLYAVNVTTVKLSILFLYRRLFPIPSFQRANMGVMVFCFVWFVIAIIGDIFYCIPIQRFWDPAVPGSCFDFPVYFLIMEVVDLLLDVIIIGLPMKIILGLPLSLRKRLAVVGIFLLGAFVIVTGAVRIAYVYQRSRQLLVLPQASFWSVVNLGTAIVCACLPICRPSLAQFVALRRMWFQSTPDKHEGH
ncbi:hypothetical protein BDV28DRAFT_148217 [Aspergillus coremiiformis]|uniref:Rhodopsin domain-containing protein n=1 Tax=Aspergillus coremiiformis TaxID=138285 RepID=A0A5N6Z6L0_9EURO|nr:hypothetical protein BDV28DRAFT_148217 [Aspergillus coremiiformis]